MTVECCVSSPLKLPQLKLWKLFNTRFHKPLEPSPNIGNITESTYFSEEQIPPAKQF